MRLEQLCAGFVTIPQAVGLPLENRHATKFLPVSPLESEARDLYVNPLSVLARHIRPPEISREDCII
jgi:hypothetical protein